MQKYDKPVLFSGYAKLPAGITASEMYNVIGLVVTVDLKTDMILEADCTLATDLARKYVASLLCNQPLSAGVDVLIQNVDQFYHGSAKKAIITALRIIYDKYRTYKDGRVLTLTE